MSNKKYSFTIFTKPWKDLSVSELGKFISGLGVDGIEFPVRAGYQVEPQNAEKELPIIANQLKEFGLKIESVASTTDENIFAACAEAGVPIIRIMVPIGVEGYMASEKKAKQELERTIPLCEKYGVKVGIQHHCGTYVSNSMEMLHLVENFDPKHIGLIWDAAHSGLAGEEPEQALNIAWSHLCMVNFKAAIYKRGNGPEADEAVWDSYFTTGKNGLLSWRRAAEYIKSRDYSGVVCLPAEYTDEGNVEKYIEQDIAYVKSLFG